MPVRQMKESSEQHLVIKPHLQNPMNQAKKTTKAAQNGKGPPPQENHNQTSPHSKNKGRRRGRGGRKPDQGDVMMRPSCRPCTATLTSTANENAEKTSIKSRSCPMNLPICIWFITGCWGIKMEARLILQKTMFIIGFWNMIPLFLNFDL